MNRNIRTIYIKILGSIMVPVFLFSAVPQAIADDQLIAITFQTIYPVDGLDAEHLFQNIYKSKVTTAKFSSMKNDPRIIYVQKDSRVSAAQLSITPIPISQDPYFTMDETKEDRQWYLPKTHIPEAWQYSKGSQSVVVAVIDTGIHSTHIELNDGRVVEGYDVIKKAIIPSGGNSDDNGHGTAVAGVIGAIPNNQKGIAGVNWEVKLMPIKTLAADGSGETSDVAAGLVWAADHGANIINLSMGGPGFGNDMTLSNAISYAYNKGVLIVAAAGNDVADFGNSLDKNPVYPICGDNGENMILGVAATDISDMKATFSNFGAICVDIAAPGKKIITTTYLPSDPVNNLLIYGSGTSLATPIVSGAAALLKAYNPNLSNVEIRNLLLKSVDNIDAVNQVSCLGSSCNGLIGKGRLNVLKAIMPQPITNGSLIRDLGNGDIYYLENATKRLVTPSVFAERGFDLTSIINDTNGQLSNYILGKALTPAEGTLIKSPTDAQVYVIHQEMKRPVTYLVFISRGYKFSDIKTLPASEVNAFTTGNWYWPPDGIMVLINDDPTVFVMDREVRRPATYFVFTQRKLSFKNVVKVTRDEFGHIPVPQDNYWLAPLDGTLIKSEVESGIYVIENGARRLMSFEAFTGRGYNFSNVKVLPQAEVDVVALGAPIIN